MPTTTDTERRLRQRIADEVDARVALIAQRDFGVISTDELRDCGLSRENVRHRVTRGRLHPLHRTVYAVGHPNIALPGRFLAAVKACGDGAVLSHFAAAAHWCLVEWDHRPVEVTVTTEGTRLHRGIKARRTTLLDACDVTRRQGIPVTAPARTALDCAAILQGTPLRRLVREGQGRGLVSIADLVEVLGRLGPRRVSRRIAEIVATGPAPTRSVLEDAVLDLLVRGGVAHPLVNEPLLLDGRRVVPDFRWPKQRLVVEADGAAWHDHKLAREDDAERQALLEAHGDRVLRVTWDQAVARGPQTLARIKAAGAPLA